MKEQKLPVRKLKKREVIKTVETNHNGDKEEPLSLAKQKPRPIMRSQAESAFHTPQMTTAIDHLLKPGDSIHELIMRGHFSSHRTDGHRLNRAFMRHIAKCREFEDNNAEEEAFYVMAGDVAVDNDRIKLAVQAIIGNPVKESGRGSSSDWQKRVQGKAFGEPKQPGVEQ